MTSPLWKKAKSKSLLIKMKEENDMAGLKLNDQKTKIMASSHIISWPTYGETMEIMTDFIYLFFLALKSLQMVTAATKLKDACSLEEKLWPT